MTTTSRGGGGSGWRRRCWRRSPGTIGAAGPVQGPQDDESELPPISIGAGLQTSFVHRDAEDEDSTDHFRVNSLRLYLNGSVTSNIKFMVNTDIDYGGSLGAPNSSQNTDFQILDAVAQFEMSDKFNIWMGRFLPPSDRANLYGPF